MDSVRCLSGESGTDSCRYPCPEQSVDPHCSFDSGDSKAFETEDLPKDLMILSPLVWGLIKLCGWYAEKSSWEQKRKISMEDQERIAAQAGWLGKLFSFVSYVIFTWAPNQVILPLTTITLHEDCPQLITMNYASSAWRGALVYEAVVLAIGTIYFGGALVLIRRMSSISENVGENMALGGVAKFACLMCLLLYGGSLALVVGGPYLVGYYVIQYASNVNPALVFGIDLRYLFVFSWPEVSIAMQSSLLQVFLAAVTCLDLLSFVIQKCKKVAPAAS